MFFARHKQLFKAYKAPLQLTSSLRLFSAPTPGDSSDGVKGSQLTYEMNNKGTKHILEREVRLHLAKLDRLCSLIPKEDKQRKERASSDLEELNDQFGKLLFHELEVNEDF